MRMQRVFGNAEMLPLRLSSRRLANLRRHACPYCFPHGLETNNNKWMKDLRCWKRYRRVQWHGFVTRRRAAHRRQS